MFEEGLSIIIPAYNASSFIEEAIESAQNTGFPKLEIIVINDGSSDNTGEIVSTMMKKNTPTCWIKTINQKNAGVSIARNRGIQESTTPWIMFLDADDFLVPNIYSHLKDIPTDGDAYIFSFICSNKRLHTPKENNIEKILEFDKKKMPLLQQWTLGFSENHAPSGINFQSSWATIYKKSVLTKKTIKFPHNVINGEDLLFRLNFFEESNKCYCIKFPIYVYYNNPNSVTNRYKPDICNNTNLFFKNLSPIINKHPEFHNQYLRMIVNNFFLEMDHFLFHKKNTLNIRNKYNHFYNSIKKDYYQQAFAVQDPYWKKCSIFKRTIYRAMISRFYKFVFLFYLAKHSIRKLIWTN